MRLLFVCAIFFVFAGCLLFVVPFGVSAANNEQSAGVTDGPFSLASAWGGALNLGSSAEVKRADITHILGTEESVLALLPTRSLTFSYAPNNPSAVLDKGIFSNNTLQGAWAASLADRSSCSASPSVFSVGSDQYSFVLCGTKSTVTLVSSDTSVMTCSGMTCTAVAPGSARITANIAGTSVAVFGNKSSEANWSQLVSATLPPTTLFWNVSVVLPPTLAFSMSDTSPIPYNAGTMLSWSAANVIAGSPCQASGDWSGAKSGSGTYSTGNLQARRDYTLTCTGPSGDTVEGTVTVLVGSVNPAPQFMFSSTATTVPYNTGVTLSWNVLNPTDTSGCAASGNWSGSKSLIGSQLTGNLTNSSYTYILTCSGPGGSTAKQITVNVTQPPSSPNIQTFEVDPDSILYNGSTKITWDVQYANQCTASSNAATSIANWDGLISISGSRTISGLTTKTEFYLNCTGAGGTDSDTITVNVAPQNLQPPAFSYFYADNPNLSYNGETTLHWKVDRADECQASGDWDWWTDTYFEDYWDTGSLPVSKSYTLICSNLAGETEQTVSVNVGDPPGEVSVSFTADPYTVDYGGETQVTWSSTNAQWCYFDWWQGGVYQYRIDAFPLSGNELWGNFIATEVDKITCGNSLGSDSAAITIMVNGSGSGEPGPGGSDPSLDPPTISFTRDSGFVSYNTATMLRWTVTNADSCLAWNNRTSVWDGSRALSGSETTGNMQRNTRFYLGCDGPGGYSEANVLVRVGDSSESGPTLSFWADDLSVSSGGSTKLHWVSSPDTTSCTASGDWSGSKVLQSPAVGVDTGALTSSKTYRLQCRNAVGSVLLSVVVTVGGPPPPPALSFYADTNLVPAGDSTILRWVSQNVTACTASANPITAVWNGPVALTGGVSTGVLSSGEYVYTISCTNGLPGPENAISMSTHVYAGGFSAIGPEATLFAEASTIQSGSSPVFYYSSNYASQCSLSSDTGFSVTLPFLAGEFVPDPLTESTTYTLSCSDANGNISSANYSISVGDMLLCPDINGQTLAPGDTLAFSVWYVENSMANCSTVSALGGVDVTNASSPDEVKWEVISGGVSFPSPGELRADTAGAAVIRVSYRPGTGTTWFSQEASLVVGRPVTCYRCENSVACPAETQYDFVNDPAKCSVGTFSSRAACSISCLAKEWEEVAP